MRVALLLLAATLLGGSPLVQAQSGAPGMGAILRLVPLAPGQLRLHSLRLGGSLVQEVEGRKGSTYDWSGRSTFRVDSRLQGEGYYWQPWFARVSSNLSASVQVVKPIGGDNRETVPTGRGSAGASATFFPASRFPLTLSFSAQEQHDGYLPLRDVTRSDIRVGFDQQYRPEGSRDRYRLKYSHQRRGHYRGGVDAGSTASHTVTGTALIDLGKWRDLDLRADFSRSEESLSGRVFRNIVGRANHQIQPMADLDVTTFASLTDSLIRDPDPVTGSETEVGVALLSSNASWNPAGKPYRGGASARLGGTRVERDGEVTTSEYALLSANGSYDIYRSRLASVTAAASVSKRFPDGDLVWGASSRQGINWSYGLPSRTWYGFRTRARVFAGVNNTTNKSSAFDPAASVGGSQGLSRNWSGQVGSWGWSASHSSSLDERAGSGGQQSVSFSLAHAATLNWRQSAGYRGNQISVNLSDSRRYSVFDSEQGSGLDDSRQVVDLKYEHREELGIHGQISAGYRFQGRRNVNRDSDDGFGYSSQVFADYRTPGLFGYARLDYSTRLTLDSADLVPLSLGEGGDRLAWHHSLNYNIGRLRTSLAAGYTRTAGRYEFDANLRIERRFGR